MQERSPKRNEYTRPQLLCLGTVKELTEQVPEKCTGSADLTLPRDVPTQGDFSCGVF